MKHLVGEHERGVSCVLPEDAAVSERFHIERAVQAVHTATVEQFHLAHIHDTRLEGCCRFWWVLWNVGRLSSVASGSLRCFANCNDAQKLVSS